MSPTSSYALMPTRNTHDGSILGKSKVQKPERARQNMSDHNKTKQNKDASTPSYDTNPKVLWNTGTGMHEGLERPLGFQLIGNSESLRYRVRRSIQFEIASTKVHSIPCVIILRAALTPNPR
jgi:hypothetical protein